MIKFEHSTMGLLAEVEMFGIQFQDDTIKSPFITWPFCSGISYIGWRMRVIMRVGDLLEIYDA